MELPESGQKRFDLEERVRPRLQGVDGELEVHRVGAVRDSELQTRRRNPTTANAPIRRVLDEDSYVGATVECRMVQERAFVDTSSETRCRRQGGAHARVFQQIGHRVPSSGEQIEAAVVVPQSGVTELRRRPAPSATRTHRLPGVPGALPDNRPTPARGR
jgi:hypothetical protein